MNIGTRQNCLHRVVQVARLCAMAFVNEDEEVSLRCKTRRQSLAALAAPYVIARRAHREVLVAARQLLCPCVEQNEVMVSSRNRALAHIWIRPDPASSQRCSFYVK